MSRTGWTFAFVAGCWLFFASLLLPASELRVTIIDTGSTNMAGLKVTVDREGHAVVSERLGGTHHVNLPAEMCAHFLHQVQTSAPLNELPSRHCVKSVSFGSSLFVEFEGERSPDLSCPGQENTGAATLQKQAREILQAAEQTAGISRRRIITAIKPQ